jgi:TPP-dependent pyruvate/acetoin dehydrogenase alpha subunit
MLQFIDPDGNLISDTPLALDRELNLHLLRWMLYLRAFDAAALSLQRTGRISFCNPNSGEEGCQIGSAAALSEEDWVFPSYRTAGVYLYRRRSPLPLLNQLFGNAADLSHGRQMPMHFGDKSVRFFSVSSPVGTQITQAAGFACAAKLDKKSSAIAISYFGDGATSTNDFHAGLNLAGVLRAPVIFFCTNNQYAISVPVRRQTASESIAVKASAYGFTGTRVDGNDVLAVYSAVKDAAARCRDGQGPVLIEAVTYRAGAHSSSDSPAHYRSSDEEASWAAKDPVVRCRKFLQAREWWSAEWEAAVKAEQSADIQEAISAAEQTPGPDPDTLFQDVWAGSTPSLERQRTRMRRFDLQSHHAKDYRFPI